MVAASARHVRCWLSVPTPTPTPTIARSSPAASSEVIFPGAIFDAKRLSALRFHAALYLHGHTVGGTNPSLVEAMAAGNPVVAHGNEYNGWVAGTGNAYFSSESDLAELLDGLLIDRQRLAAMGEFSRNRYHAEFTWEHIGDQYEQALLSAMSKTDKPRFALKGTAHPQICRLAILMLGSPTPSMTRCES